MIEEVCRECQNTNGEHKLGCSRVKRDTAGVIKPCPFCGGNAEEELTITEFIIRCVQCRVAMIRFAEDELLTVQDWNTRVNRDDGWVAVAKLAKARKDIEYLAFMLGVGYDVETGQYDDGSLNANIGMFPQKVLDALPPYEGTAGEGEENND